MAAQTEPATQPVKKENIVSRISHTIKAKTPDFNALLLKYKISGKNKGQTLKSIIDELKKNPPFATELAGVILKKEKDPVKKIGLLDKIQSIVKPKDSSSFDGDADTQAVNQLATDLKNVAGLLSDKEVADAGEELKKEDQQKMLMTILVVSAIAVAVYLAYKHFKK